MNVSFEELIAAMPEFELFYDVNLKEKVLCIWQKACAQSVWESIHDMRAVSTYDPRERPCESLIHHTRYVTNAAYECGKVNNRMMPEQVNLDYILAGALLHDVCKIVEKGPNGFSDWGKHITHGILSICYGWEENLPVEVLHIITAHTNNLNMPTRTREAAIVHHCDYLAGDCMHLAHGRLAGGRRLK